MSISFVYKQFTRYQNGKKATHISQNCNVLSNAGMEYGHRVLSSIFLHLPPLPTPHFFFLLFPPFVLTDTHSNGTKQNAKVILWFIPLFHFLRFYRIDWALDAVW